MELQRLMAKAKSMPVPPQGAVEEFAMYDPATGLFVNGMTGEFQSVWDEDGSPLVAGAMTDGSKRREEMISHGPTKKLVMPKAKSQALGFSEPSMGAAAYSSMTPAMSTPFPDPSEEDGIGKHLLPSLPDDVTDVPTWGRTVIGFGLYKDQNLSYEELVMSDEPRKTSYVKWCRSRTKCAQGQLKDFCNYLQHMYQQDEGTGQHIPGTSQPRRLK